MPRARAAFEPVMSPPLRAACDRVVIDLPEPPSANRLFANAICGRVKTAAYKSWIKAAGWELVRQRPGRIEGQYELLIELPATRADPGNTEKALSDLLVTHGVVQDDGPKFCRGITIRPTDLGLVRLTVTQMRAA